jgi:hypothetical protein
MTDYKEFKNRYLKKSPYWLWVLIVLTLALPFFFKFVGYEVEKFDMTDVTNLFGALLLISLLLERASEVFITTWRRPYRLELDLTIENLTARIKKISKTNPDSKALSDKEKELEAAKKEQREYRSCTKLYAVWATLAFALIISFAGIRSLQTFFDVTSLNGTIQKDLFDVFDVLLTGGLIAGGSKGIHKVSETLANFMDTTAKRAKGEGAKGEE